MSAARRRKKVEKRNRPAQSLVKFGVESTFGTRIFTAAPADWDNLVDWIVAIRAARELERRRIPSSLNVTPEFLAQPPRLSWRELN